MGRYVDENGHLCDDDDMVPVDQTPPEPPRMESAQARHTAGVAASPAPGEFYALIEMGAPEQVMALYAAFAKAQGTFPAARKSRQATIKGVSKGGSEYSYNYRYADLGDVIEAAYPSLSANGLCITNAYTQREGKASVMVQMAHAEGGRLRCYVPIVLDSSGGRSTMQGMAAGLSAGRRLGLMLLTGISAEETDDEEVRDAPPTYRQTPAPMQRGRGGKE